jgi:hypothetical protein
MGKQSQIIIFRAVSGRLDLGLYLGLSRDCLIIMVGLPVFGCSTDDREYKQ